MISEDSDYLPKPGECICVFTVKSTDDFKEFDCPIHGWTDNAGTPSLERWGTKINRAKINCFFLLRRLVIFFAGCATLNCQKIMIIIKTFFKPIDINNRLGYILISLI